MWTNCISVRIHRTLNLQLIFTSSKAQVVCPCAHVPTRQADELLAWARCGAKSDITESGPFLGKSFLNLQLYLPALFHRTYLHNILGWKVKVNCKSWLVLSCKLVLQFVYFYIATDRKNGQYSYTIYIKSINI